MAGKMCPDCGEATFHKTPTGRECSQCGYEMKVPANSGKGGRGKFCPNCDRWTVFDGECTNCGATFKRKKK